MRNAWIIERKHDLDKTQQVCELVLWSDNCTVPQIYLSTVMHYRQMTKRLYLICMNFPVSRSCIYSLLTKGRPYPFNIMLTGVVVCSINGFLQAHYLLHCATFHNTWFSDACLLTGKTNNNLIMGGCAKFWNELRTKTVA